MALFPIKLLLLLSPPARLTIEADRANLETKFLVPLPKIRHSHVDEGERVGQRSVKFQHRPLLPRARLQQRNTVEQSKHKNKSRCVHAFEVYQCYSPGTRRTAH